MILSSCVGVCGMLQFCGMVKSCETQPKLDSNVGMWDENTSQKVNCLGWGPVQLCHNDVMSCTSRSIASCFVRKWSRTKSWATSWELRSENADVQAWKWWSCDRYVYAVSRWVLHWQWIINELHLQCAHLNTDESNHEWSTRGNTIHTYTSHRGIFRSLTLTHTHLSCLQCYIIAFSGNSSLGKVNWPWMSW